MYIFASYNIITGDKSTIYPIIAGYVVISGDNAEILVVFAAYHLNLKLVVAKSSVASGNRVRKEIIFIALPRPKSTSNAQKNFVKVRNNPPHPASPPGERGILTNHGGL